jgi:hypothetical protein
MKHLNPEFDMIFQESKFYYLDLQKSLFSYFFSSSITTEKSYLINSNNNKFQNNISIPLHGAHVGAPKLTPIDCEPHTAHLCGAPRNRRLKRRSIDNVRTDIFSEEILK